LGGLFELGIENYPERRHRRCERYKILGIFFLSSLQRYIFLASLFLKETCGAEIGGTWAFWRGLVLWVKGWSEAFPLAWRVARFLSHQNFEPNVILPGVASHA
jgi:hypothetical protein